MGHRTTAERRIDTPQNYPPSRRAIIRLDTLTLARLAENTDEQSSSTAMLGDWSIHDFNATDNFLVRAYKPSRGKFVVIAFRGSDK